MTGSVEPSFLLDTNICIYLLNPLDREVALRVAGHMAHYEAGVMAISAITVGELLVGAQKSGTEAGVRQFINEFTVLPFDQASADCYAQLPFRRASFDRLIGATALAHGLTVITNNEADFADIPGLKVENWTA